MFFVPIVMHSVNLLLGNSASTLSAPVALFETIQILHTFFDVLQECYISMKGVLNLI